MRINSLFGLVINGGALDASNYLSVNGERISGLSISERDEGGELRTTLNSVITETRVRAELSADDGLRLIAPDPFSVDIVGSADLTLGLEPNTWPLQVDDATLCDPQPLELGCAQVELNAIEGGALDNVSWIEVNGERIAGIQVEPADESGALALAISESFSCC